MFDNIWIENCVVTVDPCRNSIKIQNDDWIPSGEKIKPNYWKLSQSENFYVQWAMFTDTDKDEKADIKYLLK